jgi:hypothetical protein
MQNNMIDYFSIIYNIFKNNSWCGGKDGVGEGAGEEINFQNRVLRAY